MSDKLKIPTLRFKDFSGEWEEKEYGEIYTFYSTNSLSRDKLNYDDGTVKNIHYGDIHTKFSTMFNIKNEKVPFINSNIDLSKIKEENYCLEGDLVIADASEDYADIGKTMEIINLNNEKIIAGLHTFLARADKYDIALGYGGYLLQSWKVRKQVMTIAQGTKVLSLSTTRLSKIELNLPQKQEQEKIASFLSSIDKKIEKLSKKDELLQSYKKGAMQKIFSQEIRFKADDGSNYSDWEEKKLGKISDVRDGTHDSPKYYDDGYPLITSKNLLKDGRIDFDNVSLILKEDYININKRSKVDINDILFGMIGTIGNPVIVNKEGFAIKNVALIKEQELLLNRFLIHYLKSFLIEKQFYEQNTGGTQKFIALGVIRDLNIKLPCLEEQTKIANFLSSIDTKISQNKKALEVTKKFKKALLQQMFV